MQIEFLLEEESAEDALRQLMPRLLPAHYVSRFRPLGGWQALMKNLPTLLRGYRSRMAQHGQHNLRVVVLLDADGVADRRRLELEAIAQAAGLLTLDQAQHDRPFQVFNALAVQELEAWFLGDREAIMAAYPKVKTNHFKGIDQDPENHPKPSKVLKNILIEARVCPATANDYKREWAETIAPHLNPARNQSASFQYFRQGLAQL